MGSNIGHLDRIIRVTIGLLVLSIVLFVPTHARWFGLIGLLPLVTAILGECPLYTILGISTCKPDERPVM